MSDTPETDEQINGKPCTRFEVYVGDSLRDAWVASEFARKLERERDRYKSDVEVITKERDMARWQRDRLAAALERIIEEDNKPMSMRACSNKSLARKALQSLNQPTEP